MAAQAEEDLGVLALFDAGTVTAGIGGVTVCRPELRFVPVMSEKEKSG